MDFVKEQIQIAIAKLRVNVKSLAAEAKIIRHECRQRRNPAVVSELHFHRVGVVRCEARAAQLALAAFRSRQYRSIEGRTKTPPDWGRVEEKIKRAAWHPKVREVALQWVENSKRIASNAAV